MTGPKEVDAKVPIQHAISLTRPSEARAIRDRIALQPGAHLLESGEGFGQLGRWSIYACFPRAHFSVTDQQWRVTSWKGRTPPPHLSPFESLRFVLKQTEIPSGSDDLPFQGGWMGFLGYDLAPLFENIPRRWPRTGTIPDLSLAYFDTFAVFDRKSSTLTLVATSGLPGSDLLPEVRLEALRQIVTTDTPLADESPRFISGTLQSDCSREEYVASIDRVIEYLRAGDIFQANLSQEFSGHVLGRPEEIFRRACETSPAPFGSLLKGETWSLVSTSPERFLLKHPTGHVETRPIKGTRPRGRDPLHDVLLKDDLLESSKDSAELAMIVDLERNDLGRVCEYGTIRVESHRAIESYSNVHHAVSAVTGQLREGKDWIDLIQATFPGGSVTGAPKIRAMQIIDELEKSRRGPYTGAIGYISDHGRADWSVAIRTMIIDGETIRYRVGGGIVVDSDPEAEFQETLVKGIRMRAILEGGPEAECRLA